MGRITRRFISHKALLICTILAVAGLRSAAAILQNGAVLNAVDDAALNQIYKAGENGYACFRIPALLTTPGNVLLAFAEARRVNCGDAGDIDLVLKRSADGGKTWSAMQVVWSDSTNTCGNPVPILDRSNGRIVLVSTWNLGTDHEKQIMERSSKNGRHVYVLTSDDEGKSWSTAREITSAVKIDNWTWYATGPCHGLQISSGVHKGRLVVPVNHVESPSNKNYSHIIYSDDHGENWKLGNNTPQDMVNETTVAEISGGRLMLNMRNANRKFRTRNYSISNDGGQSWSDVKQDSTLIEPVCQGTLLSLAYGKKPVLLFANPAHQTKRENLTLRMSYDDGVSWMASKVIHPGPSAYSDIAPYKKKDVAILYESGKDKPYEGIAFKLIRIKEIGKR